MKLAISLLFLLSSFQAFSADIPKCWNQFEDYVAVEGKYNIVIKHESTSYQPQDLVRDLKGKGFALKNMKTFTILNMTYATFLAEKLPGESDKRMQARVLKKLATFAEENEADLESKAITISCDRRAQPQPAFTIRNPR